MKLKSNNMLATDSQQEIDYSRIEKAIHFIEENLKNQPTIKQMADYVNLSEFHFDRMFTKWAGTSPQRFMRFLTKEYAKNLLNKSDDILQTTMDLGLSSTSRLHDLFVTFEAISPGEYKKKGAGIAIFYGFQETVFGLCALFMTDKGILEMSFIKPDAKIDEIVRLKNEFPEAEFSENSEMISAIISQIFDLSNERNYKKPIHLLLRGTNFQIKVWEALLKIQVGQLACYEDIATEIGQITAQRAVGSAIGANHIAYIIPCHRVIQKVGTSGNYRWGATRKRAMIGWEASKADVV